MPPPDQVFTRQVGGLSLAQLACQALSALLPLRSATLGLLIPVCLARRSMHSRFRFSAEHSLWVGVRALVLCQVTLFLCNFNQQAQQSASLSNLAQPLQGSDEGKS